MFLRLGDCLQVTWEARVSGHVIGAMISWTSSKEKDKDNADSMSVRIKGARSGGKVSLFDGDGRKWRQLELTLGQVKAADPAIIKRMYNDDCCVSPPFCSEIVQCMSD